MAIKNLQADKCYFKHDTFYECNIATEMICDKRKCTLFLASDSEKAKKLLENKKYK